ncbi:MAG: metallophosphoesterase family protein [Victivallaceae bacterium]|nr:metallophosphoesterase family protein [Victivallaceae bacterium]
MPKIAILSDIHANADALTVVLQKCADLGIGEFVSLGDIVGYNAQPVECIGMVRDLNWLAMVRGNHDEFASNTDNDVVGFNPNARVAVLWTRAQLSIEDRAWLHSTPMRAMVPNCNTTIVHATLDSPDNWGYIFDMHHATDSFHYQFTQLCFCGHSHVPVSFEKRPLAANGERSIDELTDWTFAADEGEDNYDFTIADELKVNIKAGYKYLFNIGSIGQPRNRDPRASFAVLDTEHRTVTRYRLPYDVAAAQAKIIEAGLPERLAARLSNGS